MDLLSPLATADAPPPPPLRREVALHLLVGAVSVVAAGIVLAVLLDLPDAYAVGCAIVYLAVAAVAATGLDRHGNGDARHRGWGHANRVTLGRGVLIALVGGAMVVPTALDTGDLWVLSVIAVIALALDGVDGPLARAQRMTSPYGARFDMELDTLLTLVLALLLWRAGEVGVWVLALGLLRHVFVLAGMVLPALTAPLPFSQRRRIVCVIQIAVLAAGLTPVVAAPVTGFATGAALALLLFSFLVDTVWLLRQGDPTNRRNPAGGTADGACLRNQS
jgi:phosphatidylglycerophosphate synthase